MPTRRDFVTSTLVTSTLGTLGAGAVLATQGPRKAAAQVDRRMIVDAQVHLWKAESPDWKWVPGLQPQLPEPFTIERLVPMMDEAGVDRVVIVPPSWPGDRNDYALEAVRRYPSRFRIMGKLPLQDPKAAAAAEMAGAARHGRAARDLQHPADAALAHRRHRGLVLGGGREGRASGHVLCARPRRGARPVAERHPGLTLILDHMAVTGAMVKDNTLAEAIGQTVALAKYPNVSVKLSASPGLSREPYPYRDVAVHIKRVFDAFGPQRSYWGTDLTNTYAQAATASASPISPRS